MCFSAQADVVGGLVVVGIGLDALRHVGRRAERLLAALPVVLGAHQLIEGIVWWGLEGHVSARVWEPARFLYLTIAFGVLPVLVPLAVGALEPVTRRLLTASLTVVGVVVAVVLMFAVVDGPVESTIVGHHIAYRVELWQGGLVVVLYVAATCGSLLVSSHRHVRWFGAANLVAVCLLGWLSQRAFISLWCAWAALASIAIAFHLRAGAVRDGRRTRVVRFSSV
jgi:hypothetical protein